LVVRGVLGTDKASNKLAALVFLGYVRGLYERGAVGAVACVGVALNGVAVLVGLFRFLLIEEKQEMLVVILCIVLTLGVKCCVHFYELLNGC